MIVEAGENRQLRRASSGASAQFLAVIRKKPAAGDIASLDRPHTASTDDLWFRVAEGSLAGLHEGIAAWFILDEKPAQTSSPNLIARAGQKRCPLSG